MAADRACLRLGRVSAHLLPLPRRAAANGRAAAATQPQLRVAPFEFDVTPPIGTPLMNGGVDAAAEIKTPLTARGIVLLGVAGGPVVLCSVDWVGIGNESHDRLRVALARGCATSASRVALHTIHQHDAPGADSGVERLLASHGLGGLSMVEPYLPEVAGQFEAASREAFASGGTAVTHVGVGSAEVERVASNRHIMGPDGLVKLQRQSSTGSNPEAAAAPEGVIDRSLRCLGLWHGERALVSLSYYATHPMCGYGKGSVQWDFIGMARKQHEATLPSHAAAIHFTGAAGNVAAGKYNDGKPERKHQLAGRVAAAMLAAWADASTHRGPVTASEVAWHSEPVLLPLKADIANLDEAALLAHVTNDEGALLGNNTSDDPRTVYPRLRAARDLEFARRVRAGRQIELTCLSFGSAACESSTKRASDT